MEEGSPAVRTRATTTQSRGRAPHAARRFPGAGVEHPDQEPRRPEDSGRAPPSLTPMVVTGYPPGARIPCWCGAADMVDRRVVPGLAGWRHAGPFATIGAGTGGRSPTDSDTASVGVQPSMARSYHAGPGTSRRRRASGRDRPFACPHAGRNVLVRCAAWHYRRTRTFAPLPVDGPDAAWSSRQRSQGLEAFRS